MIVYLKRYRELLIWTCFLTVSAVFIYLLGAHHLQLH